MAIGNPVNPGLVNAQLGQVVANLRNACRAAIQHNGWVENG